MSKGLEALNKIIDMASEPNGYLNFQNAVDTPYYQIVEKELKALEILKMNILGTLELKWEGKWWTIKISLCQCPVGYGHRKEDYILLKEVLYENF